MPLATFVIFAPPTEIVPGVTVSAPPSPIVFVPGLIVNVVPPLEMVNAVVPPLPAMELISFKDSAN